MHWRRNALWRVRPSAIRSRTASRDFAGIVGGGLLRLQDLGRRFVGRRARTPLRSHTRDYVVVRRLVFHQIIDTRGADHGHRGDSLALTAGWQKLGGVLHLTAIEAVADYGILRLGRRRTRIPREDYFALAAVARVRCGQHSRGRTGWERRRHARLRRGCRSLRRGGNAGRYYEQKKGEGA